MHISPDVLRRPSAPPRLSHHSSSHHVDTASTPQFPMLSESEEAHMSLARGGGGRSGVAGYGSDEEVILEDNEEASFSLDGGGGHGGRHSPAFSSGSPRDRRSPEPSRSYDEATLGGALRASPGMLGGTGGESSRAGSVRRMDLGGFATRNRFQFDLLEDFAQVEKITLGAADMTPRYEPARDDVGPGAAWEAQEAAKLVDDRTSVDMPRSSTGGFDDGADEADARSAAGASLTNGSLSNGAGGTQDGGSGTQPSSTHTNFVRRRQRKLSQSNPAPHARRQAKVALFEGGGNATASSSFPFKAAGQPSVAAPLMPSTVRDSKSSLYDTFTAPPPPGLQPPLMPQPNLQDRPYRFSFYSNALPSTIHARSLSELPAEGQTFEDLFSGRSADDDDSLTKDDGSPQHAATARTSGTATPKSFDGSAAGGAAGKESLLSKAIGLSKLAPANAAAAVERERNDPESTTWWLDVLCPTDDEMKTLSKVRARPASPRDRPSRSVRN